MKSSPDPALRIGAVRVEPALNQICKDGTTIKLEPRTIASSNCWTRSGKMSSSVRIRSIRRWRRCDGSWGTIPRVPSISPMSCDAAIVWWHRLDRGLTHGPPPRHQPIAHQPKSRAQKPPPREDPPMKLQRRYPAPRLRPAVPGRGTDGRAPRFSPLVPWR